jgi:hypothetical protein
LLWGGEQMPPSSEPPGVVQWWGWSLCVCVVCVCVGGGGPVAGQGCRLKAGEVAEKAHLARLPAGSAGRLSGGPPRPAPPPPAPAPRSRSRCGSAGCHAPQRRPGWAAQGAARPAVPRCGCQRAARSAGRERGAAGRARGCSPLVAPPQGRCVGRGRRPAGTRRWGSSARCRGEAGEGARIRNET